jgi:hypothetical protein
MKSRILALGAFALLCLAEVPAFAAPVSSLSDLAHAQPAAVEQIQYRRGYAGNGGYRGGYGVRRYGYAPWIGLGAGIAAGAFIYSRAYLPRRGAYYDTYAYDGPY